MPCRCSSAGAVIFVISLIVHWPLEPVSYSAMIIGIYFMLYNIACVKGERWNTILGPGTKPDDQAHGMET